MKQISEFLNYKDAVFTKAEATDGNIRKLIDDELNRVGLEADLNFIDTSKVTNMSKLFVPYEEFNGDISKWDVSNVTNMSYMFSGCKKFNGDISEWNVKKVIDMESMFDGCIEFNSNISNWTPYNVETFYKTFKNCENFNRQLSGWDVHSATNMNYMFFKCKKFTSDLSMWNVENCKSFDDMFYMCESFNSNLSKWDMSMDSSVHAIFYKCRSLDFDLNKLKRFKNAPKDYKFCEVLTHRNYLGAVLNTGIERNKTGDILIGGKDAYLICTTDVAYYIKNNLYSVSKTYVNVEIIPSLPPFLKINLKDVNVSCASDRIDLMISKIYNLSRNQSNELFKTNSVYINDKLCTNNSYFLKENDIVSLKGYGRFCFIESTGVTKKGNKMFLIKKYC